ncbi:MAG: hypothetical protein CSB55_07355 [Candidatus Cloacimonadota bacterium]|nr:MAG: hypothetical protein CSB55_07355 [Candidatus Cloacimonadota bacterium]
MKFLFFFEREMHIPVLKNVIRYIHENKLGEIGVTGFIYTKSSPGIPGRGFRREILDFHCPYNLKVWSNPADFKPDITFTADFSYHFLEGLGKIVNIGHGTISKGWFFSEKKISLRENCADLICVPGEIHKEFLSKNVKIPIEVTGMPKLDDMFSSPKNRNDILKELQLNPANKTILIAPTFNNELSLIPYLGSDIEKYIPSYLNVIIKLHGAAPEEWREKYKKIADKSKNIAYTENGALTDCFIAADLMISDVSSVIYEFASLEKPVLLFDSPDQKLYQNYDPDSIEYVYRNIGKTFNDFAKLPELLFNAFLNPVSDAAKEIGRKFIGVRDGSSAQKIVNKALKIYKEAKTQDIVLLDFENDAIKKELKKRFSSKFKIIESKNGNFADNLKKSAEKGKNIHYIGEAVNLTPFYPIWMNNHLNGNNVLCFPLTCDKSRLYQDNISFHVKFNSEMTDLSKSIQITYGMCGEEEETDFLRRRIFSIKSEVILNLKSEEKEENPVWHDIFKSINKAGMKAVIAKDAYVYPLKNNTPDYDCLIGGWKDEKNTDKEKKNNKSLTVASLFNPVNPDSEEDQNPWYLKNFNRTSENDENSLKQAVEEEPFNTENILKLIRFYYENDNYEMVDVYADMITESPEAELLASRSAEKQDLPDEALEKISRIDTLKILDKNLLSDILIQKGRLLIKNQRSSESFPLLEEAIELTPEKIEAYINLGSAYLINNDLNKAHHIFEQGRKQDKSNVGLLNGLGIIKQNQGFYAEASELYLQILGMDPENLNALQGLLGCVYQTGHFIKIIPYLENYKRRHPENTEMCFVLSGVYFEAGDYQNSLDCVNSILTFTPDFPGAEELKNKIMSKI